MENMPSRDEHEKRASEALFGDEDYVPMYLDREFLMTDGTYRLVTYNELVEEYRSND